MRNAHQMVINDVRKVVSWKSIILHDYLVVDHVVVESYFPVDHVLEGRFAFGHLHPDNVAFSIGLFLKNLVL